MSFQSTCVCCGSTDEMRGVNLSRGSFTLCALCRSEWEGGATREVQRLLRQTEDELADARRTIRAALDPGIQREWRAAAGTSGKED